MQPFADIEAQLKSDGRALRGLARDLVGDLHAADDLVQEAARRTLQSPPRQGGALGGWLRTVVLRLGLQHRRAQRHRHTRERAAARGECVEATVDVAARREALRAVTAALFALDEPYQTTLVLRYFEDRSPTEIAASTNTSLATVKSRLQRGLQLMRARLDANAAGRDWRRALIAAAGLPPLLTTAALLTTGALMMSNGSKIAILAAAAAACAAVIWSRGDAPAPVAAQPVAAARTAPVDPAAQAPAREPAPAERSEVATAEPVPPLLAHPFEYDLQIEVRDRDGLPVANAQAWLGPAGCALAKVPATTGPDGIVHAQWRGKQPTMELALQMESMHTLHRVLARAGAPQRAVVEGRSGGGNLVLSFVLDQGDKGRARVHTLQPVASTDLDGLVFALDSRATTSPFQMAAGLHPFAVFGDALAAARHTGEQRLDVAGEFLAQTAFHLQVNAATFDMGQAFLRSGITVVDSEAKDGAPPPTVLEGTVYDEQGKPVPHATVCWGDQVDVPAERAQADDKGNFRFTDVKPGAHELRAGGGDAGLARAHVDVVAEKTTHWEARLQREAVIRGRALDAQGKPLAGWIVEVEDQQRQWNDACKVHDDGSFVLPNQPPGLATVLLRSKDDAVKLPVAVAGSVLPDSNELLIRYDAAAAAGKLQLEPQLPEGVQDVQIEVRVWQEETGRGAAMTKAKDSPVFSLGGLAAGWYRLEVGATQLGWTDAGRQWVDGKGALDLGRFALPKPGRVHIEHGKDSVPAGDELEQQICVRRPDCDVRVEDAQAAKGSDLVLPPGDYWLLWRDVRGARHVRAFVIRAGLETRIDTATGSDDAVTAPR
jgi:RNA polymerase sigma-70 factor (ECF subfamily)